MRDGDFFTHHDAPHERAAGATPLIIFFLQSYAMSDFKIPQKICKGIIAAMSKYWWGDSANQKKMHWMAWWKMCPKEERRYGV